MNRLLDALVEAGYVEQWGILRPAASGLSAGPDMNG
jgi:hypothetical protein